MNFVVDEQLVTSAKKEKRAILQCSLSVNEKSGSQNYMKNK